ncbi:MAG: hypothetical protein BWK78_10345 [Thiotrichaceae bacterium IS1]|nr:MAG: hypothetical protein BWK78_10345 [Thiotrichaceae bacterium IS1]
MRNFYTPYFVDESCTEQIIDGYNHVPNTILVDTPLIFDYQAQQLTTPVNMGNGQPNSECQFFKKWGSTYWLAPNFGDEPDAESLTLMAGGSAVTLPFNEHVKPSWGYDSSGQQIFYLAQPVLPGDYFYSLFQIEYLPNGNISYVNIFTKDEEEKERIRQHYIDMLDSNGMPVYKVGKYYNGYDYGYYYGATYLGRVYGINGKTLKLFDHTQYADLPWTPYIDMHVTNTPPPEDWEFGYDLGDDAGGGSSGSSEEEEEDEEPPLTTLGYFTGEIAIVTDLNLEDSMCCVQFITCDGSFGLFAFITAGDFSTALSELEQFIAAVNADINRNSNAANTSPQHAPYLNYEIGLLTTAFEKVRGIKGKLEELSGKYGVTKDTDPVEARKIIKNAIEAITEYKHSCYNILTNNFASWELIEQLSPGSYIII